jgi:hypothetical protein
MALKNIEKDADALAAFIGKGMRTRMGLESHDIRYESKDMENDLKSHYFGSISKGTAHHVKGSMKNWEAVLTKYCKEAIGALHKTHTNVSGVMIFPDGYSANTYLHVFAMQSGNPFFKGLSNPYNTLSDLRTQALNGLLESNPDYKELFWGKANRSKSLSKTKGDKGLDPNTYSMAHAVNLGHYKGVAGQQAAAVHSAMGDMQGDLDDEGRSTPEAVEDWENLQARIKWHEEVLGELLLKIDHDSPKFDANQIRSGSKSIIFNTNTFYLKGEGSKSNKGKDWEQKAGTAVQAFKNELQGLIKSYKTKHEDVFHASGSSHPVEKIIQIFTPTKLRKLAKKNTLKRLKTEPAKRKPFVRSIGTSVLKSANHKAVPLENTSKKQAVKTRRPAAESGSGQLASLVQLINAKLPQTVAQNMGAPGLESRSGRFASSVRITDVNQTAKGFPSIGYSYQKNPYQIFEMGAGTAPWATTARDPKKLIDASIREIAQELAVGRFYTRRV